VFSPYGDRIVDAVRQALHLSFNPAIPEDQQLFEQLHDREMLLIMDNAERCPGKVSSLINGLINAESRITLLICSQRHIENSNTRTLDILPLPVPRQTDSSLAADYPSIRLFIACAQQHQVDFTLDEEVLSGVIDICQQVEGLPLGIILAATWVSNFTVSQIADAVKRDLSVLVATSSLIPDRHRSLQSMFENSWQLLSINEQHVLEQTAVFRGGFDRMAAAEILESDGVLGEILQTLVKNGYLVLRGEGRYDLPRIVRQYVITRDILVGNKEDAQTINFRHAVYYLNPDTWQQNIVAFENDIHNIRHAWQWAAEYGVLSVFSPGLMGWIEYLEKRGRFQEGNSASDFLIWRLKYRQDLDVQQPQIQEMIGRLFVARGRFLTMLGKYTEASEVIQYALGLAEDAGNVQLETSVQLAWGTLLWRQGDYPAAQTRITQALQLAQELQDGDTMQRCLYQLGVVTMHQSDYAVAQMYLQQSLHLSKVSLNGYHEGMVLSAMGFLAQSLGDYTLARIYLQDALQSFDKTGSLWGKGTAQQNLGYVAHRLGDYDEARTWYEQALFTNRECANRYAEAKTLASLGLLFYHQGEIEAAHKACSQAYELTRQLGDRATEAEVLMVWGHAYASQNYIIEAAAAYQKALDHRQELGQFDEAAEATAGLVRLALKEGAGVHTMPFVERILDRIRSSESLKGAGEPLRVYLTCYLALKDNNDPRAPQILDQAYQMLMAQADKLENLTERGSLLTDVTVHREIISLHNGK
jgi:tetratricopeptide (TPR) repeat protein